MRADKIKRIIATTLITSIVCASGSQVYASPNMQIKEMYKVSDEVAIDKIDEIRLLWKDDMTGGEQIDLSNKVITKKIDGYVKKTDTHLKAMNKNQENDWLWESYKNYKETPAAITSVLNNIYDMALAYSMPNAKYYQNEELKNDIIYALEWINKNAYNTSIEEYGNWWDWMIGIPARLNNIVILMYDHLSNEQINSYMDAIQKHLPSIEPGSKLHTGANLADVCMNKLLQGIILKDEEKINEASQDIESVFDYVESGDGFYPDGSYVQHGIVAYTGSYGNVLIDKISNIMFLLEDSPWSIKAAGKDNIYKWIFESFDPIIYKGYAMDMVRGRSISRHNGNGYFQAVGIIEGILKISFIADADTQLKIQSLVKKWSEEAKTVVDFGSRFKSINMINEFYKIMGNDEIKPLKSVDEHHSLNMMDKTVHDRENYSLGIARSSDRISKYEFMNKENLRPWFQGDGMMYLHNNDLTQFSNNFWPTIDSYRMPGTTVDTRKREDKEILPDFIPSAPEQDEVYYELGNSNWSGGTKLGSYGIAGMQIDNKNDSLTANKSWFMFDDEIVSLGSGIKNTSKYNTETIVENRKLTDVGDNKLFVNGKDTNLGFGEDKEFEDVDWAHLQGNVSNSDIGYYFPDDADINILRDVREGSWRDINGGDKTPNDIVKGNYLTMYIDHGSKINDEDYSYVILPNKSKEETAEYAENPNVEILSNNKKSQGVKHSKLNIEGANFFENGKAKSGIITSHGKSSIMTKKNDDGTLDISVSDPTFERESITVEIDTNAKSVIEKDANVKSIKFKKDKAIIEIDVKGTKGQSINLKIK